MTDLDVRRPRATVSRSRVLVGSLVLVLLVVALVVGGVLGGEPEDADGAATATSAAPSSPPILATPPPVSPSPSGPTSEATALAPSQEPVALDSTTNVGGVGISLAGIEAIQGQATAPGDVAGPALRVTVRLENGTADPLDLLGVSVRLGYGTDAVPASPLGDPSAAPFSGSLEAGAAAEGTYVFRVPVEARGSVAVSVGYQPGAPYAVFTGAA